MMKILYSMIKNVPYLKWQEKIRLFFTLPFHLVLLSNYYSLVRAGGKLFHHHKCIRAAGTIREYFI